MEFKVPTTQAEMDALRKSLLVQEIDDDDLDTVAGGNDSMKGPKNKDGIEWECPYCGMVKILYSPQDASKHMVQECTNNPFK